MSIEILQKKLGKMLLPPKEKEAEKTKKSKNEKNVTNKNVSSKIFPKISKKD